MLVLDFGGTISAHFPPRKLKIHFWKNSLLIFLFKLHETDTDTSYFINKETEVERKSHLLKIYLLKT